VADGEAARVGSRSSSFMTHGIARRARYPRRAPQGVASPCASRFLRARRDSMFSVSTSAENSIAA